MSHSLLTVPRQCWLLELQILLHLFEVISCFNIILFQINLSNFNQVCIKSILISTTSTTYNFGNEEIVNFQSDRPYSLLHYCIELLHVHLLVYLQFSYKSSVKILSTCLDPKYFNLGAAPN